MTIVLYNNHNHTYQHGLEKEVTISVNIETIDITQ